MSVVPADALTCDSGVRSEPGGAEVIPLRVGLAVPSRRPVPPGRLDTARRRVAPGGTPRETSGVPLRLTRRGRLVVTAVAALLVTAISLLVAGAAQATNHGPAAGAARHGLVKVVVRPGQSLWSVAEKADPGQDTRAVIQQIITLNSLPGDTVAAGQQLWVPRG